MKGGFIELIRSRDGELIKETTDALDAAGVDYKAGSTSSSFDISVLGSDRDVEVIISVRHADFEAAREAMAQEILKTELPEDHYLHDFSDDELAEVIGKSNEWSVFDVVHARRLAEERGVDMEMIRWNQQDRVRELHQAKRASSMLIYFGWFCCITGWFFSGFFGIAGIGIGWSLCTMKNKTPEGTFPAYDENSRKSGFVMMWFGVVTCIIAWVIRPILLAGLYAP